MIRCWGDGEPVVSAVSNSAMWSRLVKLHGRQGEIFLALEIVIERALGHTSGIHDLLDAGAVISLSQHQGSTCVKNGRTLVVFVRLHAG